MAEPEIIDPLEPEEESAEVLRDKMQRAQAELVNMQERYRRQVTEARDQGEVIVANAFLPVIDDFQRMMAAIANKRTRKADIIEGVQIVFNKFCSVLAELSIEGFESEGQKFTAEIMDAIAWVPNKELPAGTVVNQLEQGYRRQGKLLRPAKVTVAKAMPEEA